MLTIIGINKSYKKNVLNTVINIHVDIFFQAISNTQKIDATMSELEESVYQNLDWEEIHVLANSVGSVSWSLLGL